MKIFSPSMQQFFIVGFNGFIPHDAIEIVDDEQYKKLFQALSSGASIDEHLNIHPPITDVESVARLKRDKAISSTTWLTERHYGQLNISVDTSLTSEQYSELLLYQQALRDWPAQPGWPDIDMPPAPSWLAELKK